MKKIINQESVIDNAIGTHDHHNCKTVIDKTTGLFYASVIDTAEAIGAHPVTVSQCCNGVIKTCRGHELEFVKHNSENVPSLAKVVRNKNKELEEKDNEIAKLKATIESMRADAEVGLAIRKEKETRQKAIDDATLAVEKANKKRGRRQRVYDNARAAFNLACERLDDANAELHNAIKALNELKGE